MAVVAWCCHGLLLAADTPPENEPNFFVAAGIERKGSNGQTTSEQRHFWLLTDVPEGGFQLWHRTSDDPPTETYKAFEGAGDVLGVAAMGRGLYIAYADRSVQWVRNVQPLPPELPGFTATQLPPLPGKGDFIAMATGTRGPHVLLHDPDNPQLPLLLFLAGLQWEPISLPSDLGAEQVLGMTVASHPQDVLTLFAATPQNKGAIAYRLEDKQWRAYLYEGPIQPGAVPLQVVQKQAVNSLIAQRTTADASGQVGVLLLREAGFEKIGTFDPVPTDVKWRVASADDQILLVTLDAQQQVSLATMAFPSGDVSQPVPLLLTERSMHIPPVTFLIVGAVVVGMIFLLLSGRREVASAKPNLPKGVEIAAFNRVAAAAVDMAPAVAASMVIFRIWNPVEVFTRWLQQPGGWEDIAPALVAVGLHAAHTTLSELLTASSLGKWICGCKVVDLQGKPPHAWQVLTRNVFKLIEMLPPGVLLLLPLISPWYQRLGDLLARTVVISTLEPAEKKDEKEDDDWMQGP